MIYIYILYFSWHSSMFIVKIVLRRGSQDMKESNKLYVFCKDPAKQALCD